jgi:hypothetical protein
MVFLLFHPATSKRWFIKLIYPRREFEIILHFFFFFIFFLFIGQTGEERSGSLGEFVKFKISTDQVHLISVTKN